MEALRELQQASQAEDATKCHQLIQRVGWTFISAEFRQDADDQFRDPVIQFLIANAFHSDGTLKLAREITSVVASLQYDIRILFFKQCKDEHEETGTSLLE